MARLNGVNFNAADFDPALGSSSLPVGTHPAIIKDSKVEATKDQNGGKLVLVVEIIDGPSKGATGNWNLNLFNQSQQAVDIAFRQLSALCHVIGVPGLADDTSPLHGKPFQVVVAQQLPPNDKWTEVKGVKTISGEDPKRGVFNGVQGHAAPQGNQPPAGFGQPQQPPQQQPQQQPAQGWQQPAAQPPAQQPQQSWQQGPAQGQPQQQAPQQSWQQPPAQQPAQQQPAQQWAQGGAPQGGGMPWGQK